MSKIFQRLRAKKPKDLDQQFHAAHAQVFDQMDCLSCANCCKTTSPIWNDTDMDRVSKRLRMRRADFQEKYLVMDADGDWVFPQPPCPFLDEANACQIYEDRPKACREYPHTDRKNMLGILKLTEKNLDICPAVAQIMAHLEKKYL